MSFSSSLRSNKLSGSLVASSIDKFDEGLEMVEEEAKGIISLTFSHEALPQEMTYEMAIRILKEYHRMCFARGEYEQCEIGKKAMLLLKFQNEKRHIDNIKRIQLKEREEIEAAFEQEVREVKERWEEKINGLERSVEETKQRLAEKHAKELEDFEQKFFDEIERKYNPKTRDLITLKMMEETLARQEFYFEAISVSNHHHPANNNYPY